MKKLLIGFAVLSMTLAFVGCKSATEETPAVETPAVETPAVETPATETPATETPVTTETPAK